MTENSYTIVSLLADIGGQLGLFIGAGLLPIIELCIWIIDEIKDRCGGISERKRFGWFNTATRKGEKTEMYNPAVAQSGDPVGTPTSCNLAIDMPGETNIGFKDSQEMDLERLEDDSNQDTQ